MDAGGLGSGPSGRETPPNAKLKQCDEQAIFSVPSFGGFHVFGSVFLAAGLWMSVGLPIAGIRQGLYPGALFSFLFGLLFAGMGYLALAPSTLRIEVATRTYTQGWGWRPLRKETQGGAEDFDHLSLQTYDLPGKATTLRLHWRDPKRQPFALLTSKQEEAHRQGHTVASLLRLPLVEMDNKGKPVSPISAQRLQGIGEVK
jgi:hypothetical protein